MLFRSIVGRLLFILITLFSLSVLADDPKEEATPHKAFQGVLQGPGHRPEAPADFKVPDWNTYSKELTDLFAELKIRKSGMRGNCGIPHPFSEPDLRHLGWDPPQKGGNKELGPATQYRMLTGMRNLVKFVRENAADLKGIREICIGAESAGPTVDGSLIVAWNSTSDQLKKLFGTLPSKEEFDDLRKRVDAKSRELVLKYGIHISPSNGRFLGFPGAPVNKVMPLLEALDKALAKRVVQGKKIDEIFLETNPSSQKLHYADQSTNPNDGGRTYQGPNDKAFVSLNARLIEPSEIEGLLSSDEITAVPTETTFKEVDKALAQTTDPLLRKSLESAKTEFKASRTLERREANKLTAQIHEKSGVLLSGGGGDPRVALPILQRIAKLPADVIKPKAGGANPLVLLPSGAGVHLPSDNQWILGAGAATGNGRAGQLTLSADASEEQIRKAFSTIPKQKEVEEEVTKMQAAMTRASAVFKKSGVALSDNVDGYLANFDQVKQKTALLEKLASDFTGAKDRTRAANVFLRLRPEADGSRVWYAREYANTLCISLDATDADLREFLTEQPREKGMVP